MDDNHANIEACKLAIIDNIAEFSVGDRVTDGNGAKWEITDREGNAMKIEELQKMSDIEADGYLVRTCATAMVDKLAFSRANGRGGWHTQLCSDEFLRKSLLEHVEKGDMVDVLNLAGMILVRRMALRR